VTTLYFEDIAIGQRFESPWYTVTREAIVAFARDWDPQPFHLDDEAAASSVFGELSACAAHSFAIQSLLAHSLPAKVALVAGLGGDGLQLLAPVLAGTQLRLVRRFTSKRRSASRPDCGIVGVDHTLEDPVGSVLVRTAGSILVALRKRELDEAPLR
jgi:acyl dehydratase